MTERPALAAARRACERLGYQLNTPESIGADAIAWPDVDAVAVPGGRHGPRPMGVEFVDDPDPASVLSTVANAIHWDRTCLLVADDAWTADRLVEVLGSPVGARRADDLGCRTFYTGADRVHLDGGGLALFDSGGACPAFEWREEPATPDEDRAGADDRRLLLSADGDVVAVLAGTDALRCPGPDTADFGQRYRREDDRLFHVYDADDREIGVFSGVRAMRDRGFHPIPAPVVPEHLLPGAASGSWAVLDAEGDRLLTDAGEFDPGP